MSIQKSSTKIVKQFLETQMKLKTLRFITCGSVDDGKSTLIGRMLFESNAILNDHFATLKNDSKKVGTQGKEIDFALLVDGLSAEREQGITIDVAYRYFATDRRKFIVIDTPGHEQYTRNMVTGASNADLAIILVDASKGILTQTRRHTLICSVLGIKNIILAINKMDIINFDKNIFDQIKLDYLNFAQNLSFKSITALPISALRGDNIVNSTKNTNWFNGPTLMGFLEIVENKTKVSSNALRFPVQWVNRPNLNFRGFSGTIVDGSVKNGEIIKVLPSGETAKIKEIILFKEKLKQAVVGQAVTIRLDKEIDVSRGDIIVSKNSPCEVANHFQAHLVWMDKETGYISREFIMKIGTLSLNAQITKIKFNINIDTKDKNSASQLNLNDVSVINIKTTKPIPYENYAKCSNLGSFILINKITNQTSAAGMIDFALIRATNVNFQNFQVTKLARRKLAGHQSKVIWFTGLSGSGKTTIANALEKELYVKGIRTYILDGDNIRHGLNKDLGFTNTDRIENIRRIAEVSKLMVDAGIVVLTSFISPFEEERQMARNLFEDREFFEIFVNTPLEVAEARDPKGLYKKARSGDIKNFTGISSTYEKPKKPNLTVFPDKQSVEEIVKEILIKIQLN